MLFKTTIALLLLAGGCNSPQSTVSENETSESTTTADMVAKKMLEAGYAKGTIVYSDIEGDCPYTIRVDSESSYLLDPVNLTETYKNDGAKIWVKYTGLRRMNRCEKANPVTITEIENRL